MGRRHENRVTVSLPVRVWGMDRNGKPFIQSAHTVDITRNGGRLRDLYCIDKKGDVIRLQHGGQKANFRITWVGHPGTTEDGHVGIHCIEPEKYIWNIKIPAEAQPDEFKVEEQVIPINQSPTEDAWSRMGSWAKHSTGAPAQRVPNDGEHRPGKKRVHARYSCTGTIEVAPAGSTLPVWCVLSDISVSGCYAETTSPLPAHTRVSLALKSAGFEMRTSGLIRTSHPGVGMGISLTNLSLEDRERLKTFVERLALESGLAQAVPAAAPPPSYAAAAESLSPVTASRTPANDRSMLAAHNRTPEERERKAPTADPAITSRLKHLGTELWELQQVLPQDLVDPRILREYKESADHARQAAWVVQHWLELQAQSRDPFHILHKMHCNRVLAASHAIRHLAMDVDGGEIDFDVEGLDELQAASKELSQRLGKLLKKV
jgi:hypothetical protein